MPPETDNIARECSENSNLGGFVGTEVTHVFSGELSTGEHTFQWNPNPSLPDGIYECLIRMNGSAPQRLPMMLVR